MKRFFKLAGVLILTLFCLIGCGVFEDSGIYEVFLPEGYEDSISNYPVLYVLPQNGYYLDDSEMTELFVKEMEEGTMIDMIVVKPEFEKDTDVIEEMNKIVASVDSKYKTIKDKKYRVLTGTGVGGYLAYTVGLAERETFGVMISVRGDFTSEDNPWLETCGNVGDGIKKVLDFEAKYFDEVYTYMDAPVDDEWTNMSGSTNDLGAMFIEMGTQASAHEFTVRPGKFNDEFFAESINRVSDRLTTYMLDETPTGTVNQENVLSGDVKTIDPADDGDFKHTGIKEEVKEYFYEETFKTAATKKGKYLIYLPQDYYETERFYPTMYLLHQFDSDHTSYETDKIDEILNEGIESGLFDEMIVVIPNSSEESWWTGKWAQMITEDLIPHIDTKYRTINDARYRMTAGCCMGGQGAFGVAFTNPDYFSGMASFFGALSMAPTREEDALLTAGEETKEFLDYFSYSFICGNQDSYGFGVPAIKLNQILAEKEVDHYFFIENGGHDSEFYIPYFNESIGYVRSNMYQSDNAIERLVDASAEVDGTKVKVSFKAEEGIEEYFNVIPDSVDTKGRSLELRIPLIIQVMKDGEVLHTRIVRKNIVSAEQMTAEYEFDFAKKLKDVEEFEVVVKAAVFDRVVEFK